MVRKAFADSLVVLWEVMIGIAGVSFLASLMMKSLPLHTQMDEQWAMEGNESQDKDILVMRDSQVSSA